MHRHDGGVGMHAVEEKDIGPGHDIERGMNETKLEKKRRERRGVAWR